MEEAHGELAALLPVLLLLAVGIFAVTLARPFKVSPIVGYLLAGMTIGPYGLGLIPESETVTLLAELGVVFLLFDIGLHFSLRHIWDARIDILGRGPLQIALCAAAFGGIALAAGLPGTIALVVGGALAISSTAVVMQVLAERHQRNCPVGLTATAVLIFEDICAIFLLIFATSLEGSDAGLGSALGLAFLKAAAAFGAAILLGRYAVGPLFAGLARTRNEEAFTATALLIVLAAAVTTGWFGLSLTLGAFLAGMAISETVYRPIVQTEIKPFRGLLLGFFFITVGMGLNINVLAQEWPLVLLAIAALAIIKVVLVGLASLAFRWSVPGSVQLAFLFANGSELAFVIFALPAVQADLGETAATVLITAIAASLALTPTLAAFGRWLAGRLRRLKSGQPESELQPRDLAGPVLIIGMGEVGRTVADGLAEFDIGYTAIERDQRRLAQAVADGYQAAFGDAGDPRLWEPLAASERRITVITAPDWEVLRDIEAAARQRYPQMRRFAAVRDEVEAGQVEPLELTPVVDRSRPRGLDLAAAVLRELDVDADAIGVWMRQQQDRALDGESALFVAAA